jgi:hypothetical protein
MGASPAFVVFANLPDGLQTLGLFDQMFAYVQTGVRPQRSITTPANLPIQPQDGILNVNVSGAFVIAVPVGATRAGAPLVFKNLPGSHQITLDASGSDTFDGITSLPLAGGASVTLVPYNDGVNTGYAIE